MRPLAAAPLSLLTTAQIPVPTGHETHRSGSLPANVSFFGHQVVTDQENKTAGFSEPPGRALGPRRGPSGSPELAPGMTALRRRGLSSPDSCLGPGVRRKELSSLKCPLGPHAGPLGSDHRTGPPTPWILDMSRVRPLKEAWPRAFRPRPSDPVFLARLLRTACGEGPTPSSRLASLPPRR